MNLEQITQEIKEIAEEYNLLLVILYGSQATGKNHKESDIDIAVLGNNGLSFEKLVDLNNKFMDIFKVNTIDVKSLHRTDPLFRYQVMRDGILLYGKRRDYNYFKAYAFQDYHDSYDLFRLKEIIIKKRLKNLTG